MRDLRIGSVIMHSEPGRPKANIARMRSFARQAADLGLQMVCFPEACITGYSIHPTVREYADSIPGRLCEMVLRLAYEFDLIILSGLVERDDRDQLYLSHFVACPDGLLGVYRKVHLGPPEQGVYRAGCDLPVFRSLDTTFGIELCYDGHFPEASTHLTKRGAEIIFFAHASPRGSPKQKMGRWLRYLPARAVDNGVFVVACNQTGRHSGGLSFPGVALVVDPRGQVIARACGWEDRLLVASLSGETLLRVRSSPFANFLRHRRPEIYGRGA